MDFLKELFGDDALTFEQFAKKVNAAENLKLANIASGGYVTREEYDTLKTRYDAAVTQLKTANEKLVGFDPEWESKAKKAQEDADKRVQEIEFDYALKSALGAAKAKNATAVKALLNMDGLKLADGNIIGLNDQLEKIKSENDYLFESDEPTLRFAAPTPGIASNATDKKSQFNDVLRNALGGKD